MGPLVRALRLVQRHGTIEAVAPQDDRKLKGRLPKALGKLLGVEDAGLEVLVLGFREEVPRRYFDRWRKDGTLDRIHDLLRQKLRTPEQPYRPRTSASIDSQSVDTTSGGQERGRDNARNVEGRKRHIVVGSMGLLLAVPVTAASVDDAAAAPDVFARLEGQPMSRVVRMFADSKYHNFRPYEWVDEHADGELEIIRRPEGRKGRVLLPIRWPVERTFAWLGRCRRLSKDRERSVPSSESFIKPAMIQLMLHRPRPSEAEPAFHHRNVA